ncbi:MAG TPA: hypothetical protein VE978_24920 [Chitinophagales bacterium]|nr:hypothetical protein [Chitinophagales bacterium]
MSKKNKKDPFKSMEDKKWPLPDYKKEDDIYSREKEVPYKEDDEPEKRKLINKDDAPGEDLDIPGAELDDADEAVGEEDEENNYYSLGGDNHEDLEEDKS